MQFLHMVFWHKRHPIFTCYYTLKRHKRCPTNAITKFSKSVSWFIVKREPDLVKREPSLVKREGDLVNWETGLVKREADLVKREPGLVKREPGLVKRGPNLEIDTV